MDGRNGGERVETQLQVKGAAAEVVNNAHTVATCRQMQRGGPTTVPVTTCARRSTSVNHYYMYPRTDDHDARSGAAAAGGGRGGLGGGHGGADLQRSTGRSAGERGAGHRGWHCHPWCGVLPVCNNEWCTHPTCKQGVLGMHWGDTRALDPGVCSACGGRCVMAIVGASNKHASCTSNKQD